MGLEKLRLQGIRTTKEYSMDDSLADIQYEFDRHNMNLELMQKVETSKGYIKIAAAAIIVLNHFIGRKLALGGWLQSLDSEMNNPKYLLPLEEMYRSMHRRGPPSPWFSLAMMFFTSLLTVHFSNKMGIGPAHAPPAASSSHHGGHAKGAGAPAEGGGGGGGMGGGLGGLGNLMSSLGGLGGLGNIIGSLGGMFGGPKPGPGPVNLGHNTKVHPPPSPDGPSGPPPEGFRKPLSPPR